MIYSKLSKWSVHNSLLINLITVFILFIGIFLFFNIKKEVFPPVKYDQLFIETHRFGINTEDIEGTITIPIEYALKGVSGIEKISSTSRSGISIVTVYIDPKVKDKKKVIDNVRSTIDNIQDLPKDLESRPHIQELSISDAPVIEISIHGMVDEVRLIDLSEQLKKDLLDVDQVSKINIYGKRDTEIWVEVDPWKLKKNNMSLKEVISSINLYHQSISAGQIIVDDTEYDIQVKTKINDLEKIKNIVIRSNDFGRLIHVYDIANIKRTFQKQSVISKMNGEKSVTLIVFKSESGDVIDMVDEINQVVQNFEDNLHDDISITKTNDFSFYTRRRLNVLINNSIIGFFLVFFTLLLFLNFYPAIMTTIGIPISIAMALGYMHFTGISINLISMIGILLVLGMLVDDGIIVSENIYARFERGESPYQACISGGQEVMKPVLISTLTTISAFVPLLFMTDIVGKFVKQIPIVVITLLLASLFESFLILPSHLYDGLRVIRKKTLSQLHKKKKWFFILKNTYLSFLKKFLKYRYIVIVLLFLASCVVLFIAKTHMRFIFFAVDGVEQININGELERGSLLYATEKEFAKIEKILSGISDEYVKSYRTYIGGTEYRGNFDPNYKTGKHLGFIAVYLTPSQSREKTVFKIRDQIKREIKGLINFKILTVNIPKEGPPIGADIEIVIQGDKYSEMSRMSKQYIEYLVGREGVFNVRESYESGKSLYNVDVDIPKALAYGIDVHTVAQSVSASLKGIIATYITPETADKTIPIRVLYDEKFSQNKDIFDHIFIPTSKGRNVKFSSIASLKKEVGIYIIHHLNGKRMITVTAQVDNKVITSLAINTEMQKEFKNKIISNVDVKYEGEFLNSRKSQKNLIVSFLFALTIIFMLLVFMFRSLIKPFIVTTAIPFSVIGVLFAFWIHDIIWLNVFQSEVGKPFNFFAFLGLVGLTGIVVNDSIVLVHYIDQLMKKGLSIKRALMKGGCARLRAVIMTSITTIVGLVSMAYGWGGSDPFLKSMALTIVWGLIFSTGLVLLVLPCIYHIFYDLNKKISHKHLD